jgi:hypothetical protein
MPDFSAEIGRLRAIAAQSGDALLTEGSVNPDYQLLDLCSEALHHLRHAQKSNDARNWDWLHLKDGPEKTAMRENNDRLLEQYYEGERLGKPLLGKIRKLKATTAAGVFAKAMIVRASKTGAAGLAMSLAEDLIACPGLRESLWPADPRAMGVGD